MLTGRRSLRERLRIYEEAIRLKERGFGYKRIAKILKEKYGSSPSPGMICNWVKGRHHPLGSCNKLVMGPELAYVIGGWLGDGTLALDRSRYQYYVKLSVKDYDFAESWGYYLSKAVGKSSPYKPRWSKHNQRWVVRGSSIQLYLILKRVRSTGNPWILIRYLNPYPAYALRGLFDAEGSVCPRWYEVGFTNTNIKLITLTQWLLRTLGIESRSYSHMMKRFLKDPQSGRIYKRRQTVLYDLRIRGRVNILRFAEKVGFTIKRKQRKLKELLQRYRGQPALAYRIEGVTE